MRLCRPLYSSLTFPFEHITGNVKENTIHASFWQVSLRLPASLIPLGCHLQSSGRRAVSSPLEGCSSPQLSLSFLVLGSLAHRSQSEVWPTAVAFGSTQSQRWRSTRAVCWGPPLSPAVKEMLVLRDRVVQEEGPGQPGHLSSDLGKQRFTPWQEIIPVF